MAHYRASESKREQFRRYLEKAGVLDSLTNVLVALYEETEKPNNALEIISEVEKMSDYFPAVFKEFSDLTHVMQFYSPGTREPFRGLCIVPEHQRVTSLDSCASFLRQHLGVPGPEAADVETLRLELTELRQKYDLVLEENKELKNKLLQYEPLQEEGRSE